MANDKHFKSYTPKIGLVGTTMSTMDAILDVPELREEKEEFEKFLDTIVQNLSSFAEVLNEGIIGTEEEAEVVSDNFIKNQADLILVLPVSYTLDTLILKLLKWQTCPIFIWNTNRIEAIPDDMDYEMAYANIAIACIPTLTNVLLKNGISYRLLSGKYDDKETINEIKECATATKAVGVLKKARIGIIGSSYPGISSISVDEARVIGQFCVSLIKIEQNEIEKEYLNINEGEVKRILDKYKSKYQFGEFSGDELMRSVRLVPAFLNIAKKHKLDALAQLCQEVISISDIGIAPCFAFVELNANGVMVTCECDIPTAIAMVILREVSGDAFFSEFYVQDMKNDYALACHCGLGNINYANNPSDIKLVPNPCFPGPKGRGIAAEFTVKDEEYTLVSLTMLKDGWKMIAATVDVIGGPRLPMGTHQIRFRFKGGDFNTKLKQYCDLGGVHHFAIARGKHVNVLRNVCDILKIELREV
ncbi:MAG: hypothetical protein M1371_03240 [Actinobacteria bacterium]|nr:hypothetical protein [Actinomycetota bacterium]